MILIDAEEPLLYDTIALQQFCFIKIFKRIQKRTTIIQSDLSIKIERRYMRTSYTGLSPKRYL